MQMFGCACLIPVGLFKRSRDDVTAVFVHRVVIGQIEVREAWSFLPAEMGVLRKQRDHVRFNRIGRAEHDRPGNHIVQFTNVSRPGIPREGLHRGGAESRRRAFGFPRMSFEEELRERGNVPAAFPQRRQGEGNDVETEVEIFAELPGLDRLPQVLIGRGDDPDIDGNRSGAAHTLKFAVL